MSKRRGNLKGQRLKNTHVPGRAKQLMAERRLEVTKRATKKHRATIARVVALLKEWEAEPGRSCSCALQFLRELRAAVDDTNSGGPAR